MLCDPGGGVTIFIFVWGVVCITRWFFLKNRVRGVESGICIPYVGTSVFNLGVYVRLDRMYMFFIRFTRGSPRIG